MSPPPAPATEPAEDQSGAINRSPTTGFAAVPGHELPLAAAPINAAVPPVAEASADPGAPSAEPGGEATPPPEPAAEAADVEAECYICHGLISCSACCPRKPGQRGSDKAPRAVRLPNGWRWDRAQDGPVQTRDDADPLTDEQIDAVRESRRKLAAAPVQPAAPDELLMADAEHEVKP